MVSFDDTHIIVVAAGSGSRYGSDIPKQYCLMAGRPVLMHTIDALRRGCPGAGITLVISASEQQRWDTLCREYGYDSPTVVHGGDTRTRSVSNALGCVPSGCRYIMVHDGARPMPGAEMLRRLRFTLDSCDACGALPALPLTDSVRSLAMVGEQMYSRAEDRTMYRTVQTPQIFRADVLLDAYAKADPAAAFTDDASVVEAAGYTRISLSPGDRHNLKITNPGDIALAEYLLAH